MSNTISDTKICQRCITKGINTPNIATREWQAGIYYCDDCLSEVIKEMTSITTEQKIKVIDKKDKIPNINILDFIYKEFNIPEELQFDTQDEVCRNYEKLFNFQAPAFINKSLEEASHELEQLAMSLFIIKFRIEPLTAFINKLKEDKRKEKGLKDYEDGKETYAKPPKTKETDLMKMAKKMGMTEDAAKEWIKKMREREFNKMAGNCLDCGGSWPCDNHPKGSPF